LRIERNGILRRIADRNRIQGRLSGSAHFCDSKHAQNEEAAYHPSACVSNPRAEAGTGRFAYVR
jgi:hypothetical protein